MAEERFKARTSYLYWGLDPARFLTQSHPIFLLTALILHAFWTCRPHGSPQKSWLDPTPYKTSIIFIDIDIALCMVRKGRACLAFHSTHHASPLVLCHYEMMSKEGRIKSTPDSFPRLIPGLSSMHSGYTHLVWSHLHLIDGGGGMIYACWRPLRAPLCCILAPYRVESKGALVLWQR